MSFYVRKVTKSKWPKTVEGVKSPDDLDAELFLGEFMPEKNQLSFWLVDSIDELQNAVIAIALTPKATSIQKVDVVWVEEDTIDKLDLKTKCSGGDTAARKFAGLHREICELTYSSLGTIANEVFTAIHNEGQSKRISKSEMELFLKEALKNKIIDLDFCSEDMKEKLIKLSSAEKEISE